LSNSLAYYLQVIYTINIICFTASLDLINKKAVPEMALPFLFWYRLRIAGWNVE
jgi:hypothetical protein